MDNKKLSTGEIVGGMALVLLGKKAAGLTLFGKGIYGLEKIYRENHPDLEPGMQARFERAIEFYDETHSEATNRTLHRWGIPMIVAGAVGLLTATPYKGPWKAAAASFALGWGLNILGHAKYEKNAPAFTEDPLSFIAGPAWDVKQTLENNDSLKNMIKK